MKNWLRFSAATLGSMLLILVGVVVTYVACDGGAGVQAPERASAQNLLEADPYLPAESAVAAESSIVYFTKNINPAGLKAVYDALNLPPPAGAKVAVKLSTGEPPNSNYLRAALIKDFIQSLSPTVNIVECNTVYPGTKRGTVKEHRQVIIDHGFAAIAPTIIMDSAGSLSIPSSGGNNRLKGENFVGKAFANYDYYVVLSHFKGHTMAGLGGAIKNISIGIGSTEGKCWIHTAGKSKTSFSGGAQDDFQESMAEAGKAVVDYLKSNNRKILYINVMNNLSVDCDCFGNPAKPLIKDIGILSSLDPVALDKACVDLVHKADGKDSLVVRMESRNGYLHISHGAKVGLGSQMYKTVDLDKTSSINAPERELPQTAAACKLVRPE